MSDKPWAAKDPDEVKDYGIVWTAALQGQHEDDDPDTLTSSEWIVTPAGLTVDSESLDADEDLTTIWFSGGTLGTTYSCTNRVTTTGGRTYDWTKKLKIKSK